jgi:hypothetical protein
MRRPLLILASTVWCACASPPPASGSLRVQVNVEPGLRSLCARLVARGRVERESSAVVLSGRTHFVVGIAQEDESAEVLLQAQGYADEGCTTLMVPPENSELLAARYGMPSPAVMLTLRLRQARDGGVDADGDGFFPGQDCDDGNADVHPDAEESCLNGLDDDCDGAADCADADCASRACGMNGQCTTGGCVAPSEAGLCADGLDNDADGQLDCADADCPMGSACSDANACTRDDSCGATGCAGSAVSCTQPPAAQCFESTGRCVPETGGTCVYEVRTGACNDGLSCTQNDVCGADGSCAGTPRRCDSPPNACSQAAGQCAEAQGGVCVYPPRTGACDDEDDCTVGDACGANGVCAGTRVTCTPPGECFVASGCAATGGCLFSARSGGCAGGTCDGAGTCVPSVVQAFPFTPTNFSPSQLPPSGGVLVVSCDVTIDTSSSAGLGWTTCAGGPAAPPWSLAGSAVLLFFDSLTINAGATVRALGDRPLIIAVRGDVNVSGTLTASSDGVQGAGSEVACSSGVGGNGGASGNPQTAGGGGGGGFRNNGGRGADGDHGGSDGDRGDENGDDDLTPLRGGCRGGNGGRSAQRAGVGGRGGGALQLSVGGALTIEWGGTVSAQGEGGRGGLGLQRTGGGGGGSGGALFLEAARLTLSAGAAVVANGGAGGEGSGFTTGADGPGGQRSTQRALSFSLSCGGNGGNGGARAGSPSSAHEPECGSDFAGGGGGGSAGRIRLNAHDACSLSSAAVVSPEPRSSGNCR